MGRNRLYLKLSYGKLKVFHCRCGERPYQSRGNPRPRRWRSGWHSPECQGLLPVLNMALIADTTRPRAEVLPPGVWSKTGGRVCPKVCHFGVWPTNGCSLSRNNTLRNRFFHDVAEPASLGARRPLLRLSRAARSCTTAVSKASINVRLSVQHKCHSLIAALYQMLTR